MHSLVVRITERHNCNHRTTLRNKHRGLKLFTYRKKEHRDDSPSTKGSARGDGPVIDKTSHEHTAGLFDPPLHHTPSRLRHGLGSTDTFWCRGGGHIWEGWPELHERLT